MRIRDLMGESDLWAEVAAAAKRGKENDRTAADLVDVMHRYRHPHTLGIYCAEKRPCTLAQVYQTPHGYIVHQPRARRSQQAREQDRTTTVLASGISVPVAVGCTTSGTRYGHAGHETDLPKESWFLKSRKSIVLDCDHLMRIQVGTDELAQHADTGTHTLVIPHAPVVS